MINPKFFYDTLASYGIDFYAGVPDSLLKNLCAYITDHADAQHNIIAANEGGAMGLAAGHYLATGQIPVVYMQATKQCYALVIEKDTFDIYTLQNIEKNDLTMTREEAIQAVAFALDAKDCIVSTTGMISRELFEYRTAKNESHERDFLTVGSMGHASQIALGIALAKQDRKIWCFDGDGATIMHMGGMTIVAQKAPKNYIHVIFNNGAHDSVGGQPTVGLNIDLPRIARAVGYKHTFSVSTKEDLVDILKDVKVNDGPTLLEIKVKKGNRKDLGRPTTTPIENKEALMAFLSEE